MADVLSGVHAVLPIRSREAAKSRLGQALDAEEREVLVLGMLAATIGVLDLWPACAAIHVVSSDEDLGRPLQARTAKLRFQSETAASLNDALAQGRTAALADGASALTMLPADLPLLNVESLQRLLDAADATLAAGNGRPVVVVVPADARGGTNALLLAPPTAIEPHFGAASFEAHLRAAAVVDASVQVVDDPLLGFDLDTPDDLERLELARQLELQALGERLLAELMPAADSPLAAGLP